MFNPNRQSDSDRDALRNLLGSLEPFRTIRGTMTLQCVASFLLVAEEERLCVGDYAKRAGISMSAMSRNLLAIGDRNRNRRQGFGLVTYRANPMKLRKREYFLTDKGRALRHKILRRIRNGSSVW